MAYFTLRDNAKMTTFSVTLNELYNSSKEICMG